MALPASDDPNARGISDTHDSKWIVNGNAYDGGRVHQLDAVYYDFIFHNRAEIPVKISNSAPSCSCLANPGIVDQEVLPGDDFIITLQLDTGHGGLREGSVGFEIHPVRDTFTLHMRCEVIQTLTVVPQDINFGNYLEGEVPDVRRRLKIMNSDPSIERVELEYVGPKNDYLTVTQIGQTTRWMSPEDSTRYYLSEFDVNCTPGHLKPGKYSGTIEIGETLETGNLLIQIPYSFTIIPVYTVIPSDLLVAVHGRSMDHVEREIIVKCNADRDASIESIKVASGAGVEIARLAPQGKNRFKVLLEIAVPPEHVDTQQLALEVYEREVKTPMRAALNLKFTRSTYQREVEPSPFEAIIKENMILATSAIREYKSIPLSLGNSPWTVFHGILAQGIDMPLQIRANSTRETITCREYLCADSSKTGGWKKDLLHVDAANARYAFRRGETKKSYEDHFGQFLMVLAVAGLTREDSIFDESSDTTVPLELFYSSLRSDVTLMHDASWFLCLASLWEDGHNEWQNKYRETVSVDMLTRNHIEENFAQPFDDARMPCLGTHAVLGLVYALNHGRENALSETTIDLGRDTLAKLYERAQRNTSRDGRISFNWLDGMTFDDGDWPVSVQLGHQGHMLEWIICGVTDTQMKHEEWIHKAVNYYCKQLDQVGCDALPYGGLSHGIHALVLYQKRVDTLP